jgi:hypothetical protein
VSLTLLFAVAGLPSARDVGIDNPPRVVTPTQLARLPEGSWLG